MRLKQLEYFQHFIGPDIDTGTVMPLLLMSVCNPTWLDSESKTSIVVNPDAVTGARL